MFLITALLLIQGLVYVSASCGCHNGGQCDLVRLTCKCPDGFYGPICNQYAQTYKMVFEATPNVKFTDIKDQLFRNLHTLNIQDFAEVGLRLGNVYKIRFYRTLSTNDRERVKSIALIASKVTVKELTDFDECETGQSCFDGLACKNSMYSFRCDCPPGYDEKDFRCVKTISDDNKNTKTVIYVWAGAVAAVVLCMLGCLVFYRHRKIEKGKKLQREQEKKANAFRGVLSPTNMGEYDHHMRRSSPTASVVDGRPYNMPPDLASLYDYNNPYGQDPDFYNRQQRLSIPIDGIQNVGYDDSTMKYSQHGGYGQGQYGIPAPDDQMSSYKATIEHSPSDPNPQFNTFDDENKA